MENEKCAANGMNLLIELIKQPKCCEEILNSSIFNQIGKLIEKYANQMHNSEHSQFIIQLIILFLATAAKVQAFRLEVFIFSHFSSGLPPLTALGLQN